MTALTDAPDWPLASEDLDWFAFPRTWTRHVVAAYDDEFGERLPGWWEEGHSAAPGAVAAWVVDLP